MITHCSRKLIFLFACLFYCFCAAARNYSYLNFSVKNGLAGDIVYALTQDNDGFIWIGTETGLSRFDGTAFKNFTLKDGLSSNDITMVFQDKTNRIWISPFTKDMCYYENGSIHNKQNTPWLRKLPLTSEEKGLAEDANGDFIIRTENMIAAITRDGRVEQFPLPYHGNVFFTPVTIQGFLPTSIINLSKQKNAITYCQSHDYISELFTGKNIVTAFDKINDSLHIFYGNTGYTVVHPADNIIGVRPYNDSCYLINTSNGSYIYNLYSRAFTDTLLTGISVNVSIVDKESGVWLGTNGGGLFYFPSLRSTTILQTAPNAALHAYYFYGNGNPLIVSTGTHRYWRIDFDKQALAGELLEKDFKQQLLRQVPGNAIRKPEIVFMDVFRDKKELPFVSSAIKSMMNAGDTFVTASAGGDIEKINLLTGKKTVKYFHQRLTAIFYGNQTDYIGTLNGFYAVPEKDTNTTLSNYHALAPGLIHSIAYSHANNLLWVATSNDGIYCLQNNRVIREIRETNGLSSNVCKCIFTDGWKLYVGTMHGLNVIDPAKNFEITTFRTTDGLVSDNINCLYAKGDTVCAGTTDGVSFLDVSAKAKPVFCRIRLTEIKVSGKNIPLNEKALILEPQYNNISFSYSGLSFRSLGKIKYSYRLKGLQDQWQTTDETKLKYPSLPYGNYTLEIFATNRFNVRSQILSFGFTVRPFWWEYWWVRLLAILILAGIIFFIFRKRVKRIRQREKEKTALKEKIIELEQLAMRAQMNPHFIFNSLNSLYQYVITQDLEGASKFMSEFSRLIRILFETTTLTEIAFDKEIEFLKTYLELERIKLNNAFSYQIDIPRELVIEDIVIPSFIIQPFIENAIRHGIQNRNDQQGKITISVKTEGDILKVSVDDNGVGRKYTEEQKSKLLQIHNSKGITLTKERLALYNKTHQSDFKFEIIDKYENGQATGTLVVIYFSLKHIFI
ncbi:sensor histidine kinase [Taibaiella soli]|uniref:Signal transduction histidine kinase internal region domain-containing protein n=1 Tax=Taibaiella soli TaxID=1649169 RepID=A0A2W2BCB2_9BACT|nr:histidine kinase [Taibaiella soli]PZF71306.1 hypothetical protein DN068_18595 [Taibaiella soli]